jgi:hypothetical protein
VDEIVRLREDERSFQWIARHLTDHHTTAGNKPDWTPERVRRIYHREVRR